MMAAISQSQALAKRSPVPPVEMARPQSRSNRLGETLRRASGTTAAHRTAVESILKTVASCTILITSRWKRGAGADTVSPGKKGARRGVEYITTLIYTNSALDAPGASIVNGGGAAALIRKLN